MAFVFSQPNLSGDPKSMNVVRMLHARRDQRRESLAPFLYNLNQAMCERWLKYGRPSSKTDHLMKWMASATLVYRTVDFEVAMMIGDSCPTFQAGCQRDVGDAERTTPVMPSKMNLMFRTDPLSRPNLVDCVVDYVSNIYTRLM